jgi:CheY-like chemotaxis protein
LVVDDQWDILESLELFLQAALPGVEVVLASSAREALDAIGERRVDLVITDLRMPGMDGLEFIRRLRQTQGELPVFLMTAYVQSELAEEAKRARDYQEFIAKPIDAGRLAALARDYLRA